ncbi:phenazine biosynthesis protein PhzF family [Natrinema pellirubrum DSM 15624]|uniref:Phenazine biosynthesis protein PhzF family n=1 Tax=Natrinema pellirubrum (strain DSM 15624 / CIP 106293 / JCM 10476 / NCIMB 786 / 157) TaxID=797303 RepID=L0JR80_NATP1|nr:PhzF family phenazine biosynthesis protein [Natrinema pellirubrum]AGB32876.1 phenazine biosynthesis protein PhzF family [Natrinema pellirubrum DSM 15624]ELY75636.1 phenazine biosynthesis protein PhzF family [Natrinema pellirubrum DSM 15624]
METTRVLQVDAFTDEPHTGNPAGVVPDADGLSADQMQGIAAEMAVSETAFLRSSETADRRVRYFTPTQEVDLCGHATIGTFAHLHDEGLEPGTTTLETNVGVLEIDLAADGTVWMRQDDPTIREVDVGYDRVGDALGVDRAALEGASADIPLAVASTGLPFLIVPITYLSDVGDADPDMAAIEALTDDVDATGVYLFTFDALEPESTLHGRMFAPGAGVPEDPVTGTASGAVAAYLDRFGAFDGDLPDELRLEQGHYVDRPGAVRVRLADGVQVGGRGVTVLDGSIAVPAADEDDILEA